MFEYDCGCKICVDEVDGFWDYQVAGHIDQSGWHVTGVLPDEKMPGWAYSVGLWHTYRHPEICVFGLPPNRYGLINVVGDLISRGRRLAAGQALTDVIAGFGLQVRLVREPWSEMFAQGQSFYRSPSLEVLQLIWPDPDGRFPWELDFAERFRELQPHLWLHPDDHPPGPWTKELRSGSRPHPDCPDCFPLGDEPSGEGPCGYL
jgi:hypothetical protein